MGAPLKKILDNNNAPSVINFISIDVEGAELSIIKQMCSLKDRIFICGCVEHNYRLSDYKKIKDTLQESGYNIAWEGNTRHDLFFINTSLINK